MYLHKTNDCARPYEKLANISSSPRLLCHLRGIFPRGADLEHAPPADNLSHFYISTISDLYLNLKVSIPSPSRPPWRRGVEGREIFRVCGRGSAVVDGIGFCVVIGSCLPTENYCFPKTLEEKYTGTPSILYEICCKQTSAIKCRCDTCNIQDSIYARLINFFYV